MLSGNSLRQTVHTHRASVHQAAKLVAALLRVVAVSAGLAESSGSLPRGLWLTSPAGWLPRTGISSGILRSVIEYGLSLPFLPQHSTKHCCVPKRRPTTSKQHYCFLRQIRHWHFSSLQQFADFSPNGIRFPPPPKFPCFSCFPGFPDISPTQKLNSPTTLGSKVCRKLQ